MSPRQIASALGTVAVAGGTALATPNAAYADAVPTAGMRTMAERTLGRGRGSITFRSERYNLSDWAFISKSPTTIRITDDDATNQQGTKTSLYIAFGYTVDANKPHVLRVNRGVAIRGYSFADDIYDKDEAIRLDESTLSLDSGHWSQATHASGHMNSPDERGVDLDLHLHGLHV